MQAAVFAADQTAILDADIGNNITTARPLELGAQRSGRVGYGDDMADVFRIVVSHHMRLNLLLTEKTSDLDIMLTDENGYYLARTEVGGAFDDVLTMLVGPGVYHVHVIPYAHCKSPCLLVAGYEPSVAGTAGATP